MATAHEKLAQSLDILHALQKTGVVAIRSSELTRTHRERLVREGFIREVIRGWYIAASPTDRPGDSTYWYASYWGFAAAYLHERFGDDWAVSPEQSLLIQAGNLTVPEQLLVRSPGAHNNLTGFPHDTSMLEIKGGIPAQADRVVVDGLSLYSIPDALIDCAPTFYIQHPTETRTALSMLRSASDVLPRLLDGGHSVIAGRIAGGLCNIGRSDIAKSIVDAMQSAGFRVTVDDPFNAPSPVLLNTREMSPYVNRMRLMWQSMRGAIAEHFPPPQSVDTDRYLRDVDDIFVTDAYHSLSIEGYTVSRDLIEKVRLGDWNPEDNAGDRQQRDALAARGYWQAFNAVKHSLAAVLSGENVGAVAARDHDAWYRELFAPSVTAGILKASDLAGYRNHPVYIRGSKHVPPSREAVRDIMPGLFDLMEQEENAAVRAVLGHFFFVYTHPYMDGNGRVGRFLMNVGLASGGYPWTVVPVDQRAPYMAALEAASTRSDIAPFARFIGSQVALGLGEMPDEEEQTTVSLADESSRLDSDQA